MNLITAIIIDDEEHNRNVLRILLNQYCPTIKIVAEANSADEGYNSINDHSPQLVFLDVKMPQKSGFDLLKMFETIYFEVVFVSAFNEYAITAFEFNALGYLLKPIDFNKLIFIVNKAVLKIGVSIKTDDILQFIKTIDFETNEVKKIAVHHHEKVMLVEISEILSIEASEGICKIKLVDNKHYYSSKDLKLFEGMLQKAGDFIRINKSTIVNLKFLSSYQKGDECILSMVNNTQFIVSRRKKTEVLNGIKHFLTNKVLC